jgi:hypothetical protein
MISCEHSMNFPLKEKAYVSMDKRKQKTLLSLSEAGCEGTGG